MQKFHQTFDGFFDDVAAVWPAVLEVQVQEGENLDLVPRSVERFYFDEIEKIFDGDEYSNVHYHLIWSFYCAVAHSAKVNYRVVMADIRRDYVKHLFHKMLLKAALPQILGDETDDRSYDLNEIELYMKQEGLLASDFVNTRSQPVGPEKE